MGKPKNPVQGIRVNLHLYPEVAAQLKLACVDTAFGGIRYGEQTRIVNAALAAYFEGAPVCTPLKPSLESNSSEPLPDSES